MALTKEQQENIKFSLQSAGGVNPTGSSGSTVSTSPTVRTGAAANRALALEAARQANRTNLGASKSPSPMTNPQSMFDQAKQSYQSQENVNPFAQFQSYIDQLMNARRQATFSQLDKSRNAALSNLGAEKSTIQPKFYDARNQTAAGSQQQARNFAEYMAARGGTTSGSAAQAELNRVGTLQGNLGELGRQEAQAYTDIARRTTDVENAYQSDMASAASGLEAARMEALINQMNADRQYGLQEAGLTGMLNGDRTLAAKTADQNYGLNLSGLSGVLPGGGFTLGAQNQQFNQNMANQQFKYQQGRDQRRDYESDRLFDYGVYRDNVSDSQWAKNFEQSVKDRAEQMGYQWASLNQRERQMVADQQARDLETSRQQMDTDFNRGLEIYQSTGQMPDYMSEYGVNVSGMNNVENKAEIEGLYMELSSGNLTPEAALQRLSDAEKLKLKDPATISELRNTVYMLSPESNPDYQKQQSEEKKKRQETRTEGFMEFFSPSLELNPKTAWNERIVQLRKLFGG